MCIVVLTGCGHNSTRQITVVDEFGKPVAGVAPIPRQIIGRGSGVSGKNGKLYVGLGKGYLERTGYLRTHFEQGDHKEIYVIKKGEEE